MSLFNIFSTLRYHLSFWGNYFTVTALISKHVNMNSRKYDVERWGSAYGGWFIPLNVLNKKSVVYSVGVGDDISFDLRLVERIGCHVQLFDPTPQSIQYMKSYKKEKKLHFYPYGVWHEDKKMQFFSPLDDNWVSFSLMANQSQKKAFLARCYKIKTLMKKLKHKKIDMLKLDISGAEYNVINDMIADEILPKVLLVEFDQPAPFRDTVRMILKLQSIGYELIVRDMWDYTFMRN